MAPSGVWSICVWVLIAVYKVRSQDPLLVTHKVYFDISLAGEPGGRIVFGLFGNVVPKTVENFYKLAQGVNGVGGYTGTTFHRVLYNFVVQGGDIDGKGGRSIFGRRFKDENFDLDHYGNGWLGMANGGTDDNGSQFAIMTNKGYDTPWLNGKVVIFGKIIEGLDVVRKIETVPTDPKTDVPLEECKVVKSGILPVSKPFTTARAPATYDTAETDPLYVTKKAFLDFTIDSVPAGRVEIGLFGQVVPWQTKNFLELCKGYVAKGSNTTWTYKGSPIHRIIKNFVVQGGDFEKHNGWGGHSIWGGSFRDENFDIKHYGNGWLSSANGGRHDNVGQFAIMTNKGYDTPWLNGKVVVFGKILTGIDVIEKIENLSTMNLQPVKKVVVANSGELNVATPFTVERKPVTLTLVTHKAYFDVTVGGIPAGRIVFGLFGNTVPKTVQNFYKLAQGTDDGATYAGSKFHRVLNNFVVQGGDIDGKGGYSIYGKRFKDENFILKHYGAGWLTSANAGPDDNGSQFAIMTNTNYNTTWLDNNVVVFGKVLEGMNVVRKLDTAPTSSSNVPQEECVITKSGVLPMDRPFHTEAKPVPYRYDDTAPLKVTHKVYMNMTIDGKDSGRIVIGLFGEVVPWATKNFIYLATRNKLGSGYKGSKFHRIIRNFIVQGGDFERGNGYGGHCKWGNRFRDENFYIKHYGFGWVSMANGGPDDNGSQFVFMTNTNYETHWLDGKVEVFGKILEGADVLMKIDGIPSLTQRTKQGNQKIKPVVDVAIKDSGEIPIIQPFEVARQPTEHQLPPGQPNDRIFVTHQVFFDVKIGSESIGRVVIGLFGDITPYTVENFYEFAKRSKDDPLGGYSGTILHRVIDNFVIQGGDFARADGTGFKSIWGGTFSDENFNVKHYGFGWVAMANAGADDNGSQFAIMTNKNYRTTWLDNHHVVFGKVLKGIDVIHKIETTPTGKHDRPLQDVVITTGILPVETPFEVLRSPSS